MKNRQKLNGQYVHHQWTKGANYECGHCQTSYSGYKTSICWQRLLGVQHTEHPSMSPCSEILSWNKCILECVQDDKIFERLYSNHIFRVNRFLVLCVCFVDRYLSFYPFYCGHCAVCPSLIYEFWLPLWYLQALLFWYPKM